MSFLFNVQYLPPTVLQVSFKTKSVIITDILHFLIIRYFIGYADFSTKLKTMHILFALH